MEALLRKENYNIDLKPVSNVDREREGKDTSRFVVDTPIF